MRPSCGTSSSGIADPVGLVLGEHLVAERAARRVEHQAEVRRPLLAQELQQHVRHAVGGVGRHAARRREERDRVEGAVDVGARVDEVEARRRRTASADGGSSSAASRRRAVRRASSSVRPSGSSRAASRIMCRRLRRKFRCRRARVGTVLHLRASYLDNPLGPVGTCPPAFPLRDHSIDRTMPYRSADARGS